MKLIGHASQRSPVSRVRFDPEGDRFATASGTTDTFLIWTWDDRGSITTYASLGNEQEARYLEKDIGFDPTGSYFSMAAPYRLTEVVCLSKDRHATTASSFWDKGSAPPDETRFPRLVGPWQQTRNHCAQFSQTGSHLILGSAVESRTDVVDVNAKRAVASFWISHFVSPHPEGELMAAIVNHQGGGGVHFIRLTDTLHCYGTYLEAFPNISSAVFSPAGDRLALVTCCIGMRGRWHLGFQVHEFPSCALIWKKQVLWPVEHQPAWLSEFGAGTLPVADARFNANGDRLLCPVPDGGLVEFDITKDSERRHETAHRGLVMTLDVRYRDALLLTGGSEGEIRFWRLDDSYRAPECSAKMNTQRFLATAREVEPFASYLSLDLTTGEGSASDRAKLKE